MRTGSLFPLWVGRGRLRAPQPVAGACPGGYPTGGRRELRRGEGLENVPSPLLAGRLGRVRCRRLAQPHHHQIAWWADDYRLSLVARGPERAQLVVGHSPPMGAVGTTLGVVGLDGPGIVDPAFGE